MFNKFQKVLHKAITENSIREFELFKGIVKGIDENNYTCTVESRTLTIEKVSLRAFTFPEIYEGTTKGLIIIPVIDTPIYFFTTKNKREYVLLKAFEIDRIILGDDTESGDEFLTTIDYLNKNIVLQNKTTNIRLENDKVSIEADKIYLNDSSYTETEPLVRGEKNKTVLDKIADFLITHIHGTPVGPTTPAMPPTPAEVTAMKTTDIPATLSTQNFTE